MRGAMAGALLGAGLFLGCALVGGFGPCVPETAWQPAIDVANAPVRLIGEVWTSGPLRQQQMGRECLTTYLRSWNARNFALAGLAFYGLFGAIAAWLARLGFGDR